MIRIDAQGIYDHIYFYSEQRIVNIIANTCSIWILVHETYLSILEFYRKRFSFNFIQFIHGYGLGELCSMRQKLEPFQRCRSSLLSILHSNENDNIIHLHIFRLQFGGGVDPNLDSPNFWHFCCYSPFLSKLAHAQCISFWSFITLWNI